MRWGQEADVVGSSRDFMIGNSSLICFALYEVNSSRSFVLTIAFSFSPLPLFCIVLLHCFHGVQASASGACKREFIEFLYVL